jgi:hypothetical protein
MTFGGIGFRVVDEADRDAERLRDARIRAARSNPLWTEVDEAELVQRQWWLVHSETDALYLAHRGTVFAPHSASVIADYATLVFFVNRDRDVVFLEAANPRTWSEVVERQARQSRVKA